MLIISLFLIIFAIGHFLYYEYLKEYIEVTKIYKLLRKTLEVRDLLLLKLLPDLKNKGESQKVLNLIADRKEKSRLSYDLALKADVELNNELKKVYEQIDKMKKNELQIEIFHNIISVEKKIKKMRREYSNTVQKYNMSLTIHPKVCIKMLHMRPFEMYKT